MVLYGYPFNSLTAKPFVIFTCLVLSKLLPLQVTSYNQISIVLIINLTDKSRYALTKCRNLRQYVDYSIDSEIMRICNCFCFSYRKGALLVVDEMSDFFPKTDDDAKCVLGELEITRFDLMLRVGHAVHSFLQKVVFWFINYRFKFFFNQIHPSEGESPKNGKFPS